MSECGHSPTELVDLLRDDIAPERRRRLAGRVEACESCAEELRTLRRAWDELPPAAAVPVPGDLRDEVLARARAGRAGRAGVTEDLWRAVRPVVLPATAGVAAAAAVVVVLHLGGGLAVRQHIAVLALGLALAALLAGAAGGLWSAASRRTTRAVLSGGLCSLGGYLVLSLLHPIPSAVEFCQVRILRDPAMSAGQVCLVYAAVAALYAGVPVGVTAFLSSGGDGRKAGLAEAAVFTLLALPVLGLQFGLENAAVTGTVLAGAALGAVVGGLAGGSVRKPPWAVRAVLAAALLLLGPLPADAQALPFHTSTGITAGFDENAARNFVTFLGRSGLVRDGTELADPTDRDIDALGVVNGAILGGFTPHWTYRVIVPWMRKSMDFTAPNGQRAHFDASGVGDAILQSKWIFFRSNQLQGTTRLGVQGRVTVPLGETDAALPNGEVAPRPLQVGTGSWDVEPTLIFTKTQGRLGFLANAGWRFNTGDDGFEAGDVFSYDAAVGFRFVPWTYGSLTDQSVVAYLELNGEVAQEDEIGGVENPDSGGHTLFVSPDLQWIPTPWLLFEGSVQFPVVQDLNGAQLEHDVRFQLGTRFRFSIFR